MKPYVVLVALACSACMRGTPEQQIVNDAAAAMGGRDRIVAVKTLAIEGEGKNGNLGQDMTPEATGQAFVVSGYKRAIDFAGHRARIEQTRTPNFAYFQGMAPQKQVLGLDGDVAYNVAANGMSFTLAIDATTKLPTRVVSMADNTNLGDVAIETSFAAGSSAARTIVSGW